MASGTLAPTLSSAQTQDGASAPPALNRLPRLLIVSQPRGLERQSEFVDMGYFLARAVKDLNRFEVVLYAPTESLVATAIKEKRLESPEATAFLSEATMRKVAEAIGAVYIVKVSASRSRDGIGAQADMFVRMSGNRWSAVFSNTLAPFKGRSRRSSALDAIHAHVAAIVPAIASAPAVPPASLDTPSAEPQEPGVTPPAKHQEETRSPSQPTGPTTAEILIDRFRKSGDTANLVVTLRRAVTERPRDPKLRRELVAALRIRGWTEAARDEAVRALAMCGDDAELHRLLGEIYADLGQHDDAVQQLNEAIRIEPKVAQHHFSLGDIYLTRGMIAEAEAAYLAAREADPSNPLVRYRIARLRAQALRFKEALTELEEARKASGGGTDGAYADTYGAIVKILDGACQDIVGRLTTLRRDVQAGTLSREDAHRMTMECRDRAIAMASFLSDASVPVGFGQAQPVYTQAAALLAQACAAFGAYLETREDADDRSATLLRQEAARLLEEAARSVKRS